LIPDQQWNYQRMGRGVPIVRDGGALGLVALGASVSNLKCDRRGRVVAATVATVAVSKDQMPGAEPEFQHRNLQVCRRNLEWGGVQV
jgi:hypothetical protein